MPMTQDKIWEYDDAIKRYIQRIKAGQEIIAAVSYINVKRALAPTQIAQMMGQFATIDALLKSGALETAYGAMQSIVPDETIIFADDLADIKELLAIRISKLQSLLV